MTETKRRMHRAEDIAAKLSPNRLDGMSTLMKWNQAGLLSPDHTTTGMVYGDEDMPRINEIRRLIGQGFSLPQIRGFFAGGISIDALEAQEKKLNDEVTDRILALHQIRQEILARRAAEKVDSVF